MIKKFGSIGFITLSILLLFMMYPASATLGGSITTDKTVYDVSEDITIGYEVYLDSGTTPTSARICVEGLLPENNAIRMMQSDYFGSRVFYGENFIFSPTIKLDSAYFKCVESFTVRDTAETNSSFNTIPTISGSVTASTEEVTAGDFEEFVGKVLIEVEDTSIYKYIYVTSDDIKIMLLDSTSNRTATFGDSDTLSIAYYCQDTCSITAYDATVPRASGLLFTVSNLTTSDSNMWEFIDVDLSGSTYETGDFVDVVITDTDSGSDEESFYIYTPTYARLATNTGIIYDAGENLGGDETFNDTLIVSYTVGNSYDYYDLRISALGAEVYEFIPNYIYPNNGIKEISLTDGFVYNQIQTYFINNPSATNVSFPLVVTMDVFDDGWFWDSWDFVSTIQVTVTAQKTNMDIELTVDEIEAINEQGKTSWDMLSVANAFGFDGDFGHLIFAMLFLGATFYIILIVLEFDIKVAIIFEGFELWYLVYAGFIEQMVLVLIVLITGIMYTTKLLKTLRGEQEPPQVGGE